VRANCPVRLRAAGKGGVHFEVRRGGRLVRVEAPIKDDRVEVSAELASEAELYLVRRR
jgi:hypothetical protein